jgi:hypothetical protein
MLKVEQKFDGIYISYVPEQTKKEILKSVLKKIKK